MAVYDLEEQEQLDQIKTWWQMYRNYVSAVLMVAALGLFAWKGWTWWQHTQGQEASVLYAALQDAAGKKEMTRVEQVTGELIAKYSGTAYAGMAALVSAKVQMEQGNAKTARVQLAWAAENAKDPTMKDLARLRLATVLYDDKAYDEALKNLAAEPVLAFQPRFNELRGDILLDQGKPEEAKAAYTTAAAKLDESEKALGNESQRHAAYHELLQQKLDAIGGAQ